MRTPELVRDNTCSCGLFILLSTDRTTGRTICTGSHMDETSGVYHSRYDCKAVAERVK